MLKALQGGDVISRQSGRMLTILVIASLAINAASLPIDVATSQTNETDYQLGYRLGLEAYKYGLPLVVMQWTFEVQTGKAPVNTFSPMRAFATPADTTVVAPNFDTLYSMAWLDLSEEPQIIYVPDTNLFGGRYWLIPLYDPYTENFENLGSVKNTQEGHYAVVGPKDWFRPLPRGVKRIRSNYNRVWIIERIYANSDDAQDVSNVNHLQDLITLKPLSKYGKPYTPAGPTVPVNTPVMPTGMAYYDQVGHLLAEFIPPFADLPELLQLAEIGVGIGLKPSTNFLLSADKKAGMIAAAAVGSQAVLADFSALYRQNFVLRNGYLIEKLGTYGTNYHLRAITAQIGLGALTLDQAIYPLALYSRLAQPLLGTTNYTVTIPAGGLPPVAPSPAGFWSVTAYTIKGFLIPNPLNRFNFNDRSNMAYNPDGSVTLYLQSTPPADQQNWLPTPPGAQFEVIWRLYAMETDQIDAFIAGTGWKVPAIMPVQ